MAQNNSINIKLGFQADVSQAKQQLKSLMMDLDQISTRKVQIDPSLATNIDRASNAAAQLSVYLKNATNIDTGKIDLTKFLASIKQGNLSIQQLGTELSSIGPKGTSTFMQIAKAIATAEIPAIRLSNTLRKFGATLLNTLRWQVSSSLLSGFMSTISEAVQYVEDLNGSLNNIRIVTGYGADEMDRFAEKANQAAKSLKTTTNEYAKASLIYFQQGLNDAEVAKRTATTIKLANVTGQQAEEVSNWMTAVWNNFDNGSKSLEYYADVMTALGAATASSSKEIAGGLEKFAAIANTIGLSYEYAASALATVTSITRQSEDVVGTAFKTIFARMEGLSLGETLEDGTSLNKYSQALQTVGVNILDVNGELKDMDIILNELGARWGALDRAQKVALAQTVGGMRQYNQLISLMDNWDTFQENLNISLSSEGSLQDQANIYAESWEAARDRVSAAAETIYNELLNDEAFISIMNGFAEFLSLINEIIDAAGGLQGVLLAVTGILLQMSSKSIAAGLTSISTAFMGLTARGREKLAQEQATTMDYAKTMVESNFAGQTAQDYAKQGYTTGKISSVGQPNPTPAAYALASADDIMARVENSVASNDVANQIGINEQIEKRSDIMNQILQKKADSLAADGKELQAQAQLVQLAKKRVEETQLERSQAQQDVDMFSSVGWIKTSKSETKKNGEFRSKSESLQEMRAQMDKLSKTSIAKNNQEFKDLSARLKNGSGNAKQLTKDFNAFIRASKEAAKTKLQKAMENQTAATKDLKKEITSTSESLEDFEKKNKNLQDSINVKPVASFGENLVNLASGVASVSSAITMIVSGFSNFIAELKDGNLSFGTTLSLLTSLGMAIPMVMSGFAALRTSISGLNAVSLLSNALTKKQISDETLLNSVKGISLVLKNGEVVKGNKVTITKLKELIATKQLTKGTMAQIAANIGLQMSMWQITLIVLALVAAVLILVGLYKALSAAFNAHNIAAEKAAEAAKNAAEAAEKAKEAYNDLKESVSNWKKARENIDNLKRGTDEFREAVIDANEQAMRLINTYNLSPDAWKIGKDGIIEIDEKALIEKQEQYLEDYQDKSAIATLMRGSANAAAQKAKQFEYLRSGSYNTADTWKEVGKQLFGTLTPSLGSFNATPTGFNMNTIGGFITGQTTGSTAADILLPLFLGPLGNAIKSVISASQDVSEEENAMNILAAEYERLAATNEQAKLQDQAYMQTILEQNGVNQQLIDSLTQNTDATYELVDSQAKLFEANKKQAEAAVLQANTAVLADKGYTSLEQELISSQHAERGDIARIMDQEIIFSDWSNGITIGGRTSDESEKYLEKLGIKTELNFEGEDDFFDQYLKTMYGEEAENYSVVDRAGGNVTIQVKGEDGSWTNLDDKEDNSWSEDEMAKNFVYAKALNLTADQIGEYADKLDDTNKILAQAGIDLSEGTKDIAKALMSDKESVEDISMLNVKQQKDLANTLGKENLDAYNWDTLLTDFQNSGKFEDYENAEQLKDAFKIYQATTGKSIEEILAASVQKGLISDTYWKMAPAIKNEVENRKNALGLGDNEVFNNITHARSANALGSEEKAAIKNLESLSAILGKTITAEDFVGNSEDIFNNEKFDTASSDALTSYIGLLNTAEQRGGDNARALLQDTLISYSGNSVEQAAKLTDVLAKFNDWDSPWVEKALDEYLQKNDIILNDPEIFNGLLKYGETLQNVSRNGQTAAEQLEKFNTQIKSLTEIAGNLKLGDTIDKDKYQELIDMGIPVEDFFSKTVDGNYMLVNDEGFSETITSPLKEAYLNKAIEADKESRRGRDLYERLQDKDKYDSQDLISTIGYNRGSNSFTAFEDGDADKAKEWYANLESILGTNPTSKMFKMAGTSIRNAEDWENLTFDEQKKIQQQIQDYLQENQDYEDGESLETYAITMINTVAELEKFADKVNWSAEDMAKVLPIIKEKEKKLFDEVGGTKARKERKKQDIELLKMQKELATTEEDRKRITDGIVAAQEELNNLIAQEKIEKVAELDEIKQKLQKKFGEVVAFSEDGVLTVADNYKEIIEKNHEITIEEFNKLIKDYGTAQKELLDLDQEEIELAKEFKEFIEEQKIRNQERVIERLERQIDSLSKTKDRAWGKERIKLMEQEIGLQDKMAAEQLKLKNLYEQQAAAAREELAAYNEYVSFDKNGLLKFNTGASGIGNSEQLEELQELVDKYDEALEGMWDAQDTAIDASMESYDLRLEQLSYIIEMQILGNQENIALLERSLEKLEDKMFSAAERLNNLIAQAIEYGKQIDAYDPDKLLSGFGLTKDATDKESWVALFQKYTQANRSGTIEQLEESRDALAELETQIYDLSKSVADVLLEAFEEFGESFDKLEERSSTLSSIVDSYNNIVNLTRQFTEVDASMVQSLIDANATLSKTSMNTAKTEYETLLASQKLIQERYNSSKISDSSLASYWKQQLDEINSLVESARADFMSAWEEALQAAAEAFKASIENIVSTFEKSMTGAFGTYASMQKAYEQQSKVMNRYLAVYERTYELTKLTRKLDKDLDETDNLKARETLKDLQDEINELQRAEVEMSKNDLTFLQKKYDLRLAEIALEEAQKAKNSVTLQRNSEGGWGYVYTADQNNIAEAQQKYEDTFQQTYKSQMDNIKSLEGSLLGNIQAYLNEIKANEGDQEALERVQNTYNELLAADAAEIDRAINNINELVNETDLEGYESINFANTLLGEVLGEYETAGLWSEEFLQKLAEQVLIPTTEQITEQEKIMNDLLEFGADGSFGENLKAFEDEIIKANEQLNKDIEERGETTELADAINTAFSKDMEIVFDYYSKVEGALEKIRQALEAARWAAENTPTHTPSYRYSGDGDRTYQPVELFTTTTVKNKNKIKETPWSEVEVNANDLTVVHSTSSGGKIYEDSKGNRYSTYKTPDLYKSFETLDTGGYTGAWGTEGRLALLHQKEIVLNATDTENFLSAIGIMRSIVDIINLQATANVFNNSKLKAANIPSSGSLEQQVTIHAEFPNVTNHYEIEEALNNIVNSASQYANRKI